MKKIVQWFAIAGGAIPILLLIIKFLELTFNSETVPYSSLYGFYVWPTSILLLGSQEGFDLRSYSGYSFQSLRMQLFIQLSACS